MKLKIQIITLLCLVGMGATAQNVGVHQALTTAQQFLKGKKFETVAPSQRAAEAATRGYYVFNVENNGGYVIVSGDERTERPVLAYSTSGHFDYNALPASTKAWMDGYTKGIKLLKSRPMPSGQKLNTAKPLEEGNKVDPLCTTTWAQGTPFNNMCPTDGNQHCVTGCVVTATAQILRYHKYPEKGTGEVSYEWHGQTLSADLSQSTYQWDQMLNTYTTGNYNETQANAVALLMRDLGYASHMSYSTAESGTAEINMIGALWTNFGYDKYIRILERNYCTAEDFNAILRSELDAKRPVLMSGANDGGHTYVCDGYDERGYFHINYGWAGYQDNYYLIGTDMPYSMSLSIFFGIQPNKTGTESKNGITGQSNQDFMWKEDNTLECSLFVVSTICQEEIEVGLAAKNTATNVVSYFIKSGDNDKSQYDNIVKDQYKSFTFDDQIADGTYELYPVCRMKGEQEWQKFYFFDKRQGVVDLKVENGIKTYTNNHISDELDPGKVEVDGIYYLLNDDTQEAAVTFKNNRYASYKGDVVIPASITVPKATEGTTTATTYNVTEVGKSAFDKSEQLTSVTIGANVRSIGTAFYMCTALKTLNFAANSQLKEIKSFAFQTCLSLTSVTLPEGTTTIGSDAFNQCTSLVNVLIPMSVTTIQGDAFSTMSKNLNMQVAWNEPIEVESINTSDDIKTWTLHVPKGTKAKYESAQGWKDFGTIIEDLPTAVTEITTDNTAGYRYYTLNGHELNEKPTEPGIYIVRQANASPQGIKAWKIVVK